MAYNRLRGWACPSYSGKDGRAASSVHDVGGSQAWSNAVDVTNHIATTHAKGQNGAPGADAQSKSGSGDPGRRKWARVP